MGHPVKSLILFCLYKVLLTTVFGWPLIITKLVLVPNKQICYGIKMSVLFQQIVFFCSYE